MRSAGFIRRPAGALAPRGVTAALAFTLTLVGALAPGCAAEITTMDDAGTLQTLERGVSAREVRARLGPPSEVRPGPRDVVLWIYPGLGEVPIRVVRLRRGALVGVRHLSPVPDA